jgi:hypothetical protein
MKHLYLIITLLLLLPSCKESNKERITRLVNEWEGGKIIFPENLVFTRYVTETTDYVIPETEYKVLTYVDSMGCTSCKLQLPKWKQFITYINSITGKKLAFLLFPQSKDDKELQFILYRDRFNIPICIDKNSELFKLNRFPSDFMLKTFLLDKENEVIVIGNQIYNLSVKNLYLKRILWKNVSNSKIIYTAAEVINKIIDLGSFDKSESKMALVKIRNTGKYPLVFMEANATCGCTTMNYDKFPAKSGEILNVRIKISPKDIGFFSEVVSIKCNMMNDIKIVING